MGIRMPKKIQRKPIRYAPARIENSQEKHEGFNIQKAITIFGGLTGLIIAILWQGGRYYTTGYFHAMNIPLYQINYSVWEYAEASWFRLFVYFITKLSYPLLLIALSMLVFILAALILQRAFPKLKVKEGVKKFDCC